MKPTGKISRLPKGLIKHMQKFLTLVAIIPLFLIASQKIVTADRVTPTKIEQLSSQIVEKKNRIKRNIRKHTILTATYNQFAAANQF